MPGERFWLFLREWNSNFMQSRRSSTFVRGQITLSRCLRMKPKSNFVSERKRNLSFLKTFLMEKSCETSIVIRYLMNKFERKRKRSRPLAMRIFLSLRAFSIQVVTTTLAVIKKITKLVGKNGWNKNWADDHPQIDMIFDHSRCNVSASPSL